MKFYQIYPRSGPLFNENRQVLEEFAYRFYNLNSVSYTKLVDSGMNRIECILRVLMADHNNASNFIADYRQLLPDGDFDTFKKVKKRHFKKF